MSDQDIAQNLKSIQQKIEKAATDAGRDPKEITLVAVSKTKPNEDILEAVTAGQLQFGENRMKELEDKMAEIELPDVVWHFIGNIQTNKIKYIADRVNWIHSVEKAKYLKEIEKRAGKANRVVNALIQVNISGEKQKGGCEPEDLAKILESAQNYDHVIVRGLMGMATFVDDPEDVRSEFKLLKELFDSHQKYNEGSVNLEHLSMGMTNDMEVAIQEGATMVRIGSAIFGERNYD
ncbi:MAG: YggS family pyridoxal phosphate-dependent enzyme [Gracilimonas sp.]|uniref:YggS family pyridoxal phosphate-dependent enzyme n=1 Tax=Gracilimonas sp. TaxID=1974203 RepID=UPI001B13BA7D|nr:YggS family pyridoxal phosphate-dependent enzyme [Gracilimonas sp.]MBO6584785.1 YggS family pyridoxal phosphate-dependent enzyme [Gracilimonas sp.]MBO6615944.1 YggS family pyridoxal phosphate-dependent enzyme [Gracilimonas sp.]